MNQLKELWRKRSPDIVSGLAAIGLATLLSLLARSLGWAWFVVLLCFVGGAIACANLAFRRVQGTSWKGRKWRYAKWHSWAVAGLVIFVLVGAGTLAYRLAVEVDTSARAFAELVAEGIDAQSRGWYREALSHFQQALVIARGIGDRAGEGATLNNIGAVCDDQGLYEQALENYRQALVIARDVGLRTLEETVLANIKRLSDH